MDRLRRLHEHLRAERAPLGGATVAGSSPSPIGVVDLSAWTWGDPTRDVAAERAAAARALGDSFERTGFALVVGHGVDPAALRAMREKALTFFNKPQSEKMLFSEGKGYGFGGYLDQEENGAQLLGDFGQPADHVESVSLARGIGTSGLSMSQDRPTVDGEAPQEADEADPRRPTVDAGNGGDSIALATAGAVPPVTDGVEGFAEAVEEYFAGVRGFCEIVERVAEAALGLPPLAFNEVARGFSGGVRLAYYPDPEKRPRRQGQQRYGAHVDSGGITVLSRDAVNPTGLEILVDDEWLPVPPLADSIVLNVGALLSRYTNGRWKAAQHRVVNGGGQRLSIVTGCVSFRSDAVVGVLPECVDESGTKFEPVLAGEYISERAAMHRLDYTEGKTEEELEQLSAEIRAYQV